MKKLFPAFLLMLCAANLVAQSPYSVTLFNPVTMTATNQTSTAIVLGQKQGTIWKAGSYAAATITLTGSSLTTATFGVTGSSDGGVTYAPIAISAILTPGTTAATATATTAGLYQVNLAGLTHIKFVTSGTFTATSITVTLTASPNAQIGRSAGGAGGTCGTLGGDLSGTCAAASVVGSHIVSGGASFTSGVSVSATSSSSAPVLSSASTQSGFVDVYTAGESAPGITAGSSVIHRFGRSTALGDFCDITYLWNGNGFNNNTFGCYNGFSWQFRSFYNGDFESARYTTSSNCASAASPAVCGAASAGRFVIAAGTSSVVINTTAVYNNSEILITPDDSLGTALGVTCNTTPAVALAGYGVIGRVAGTSFTVGTLGTVTTNPACYSYFIVNS